MTIKGLRLLVGQLVISDEALNAILADPEKYVSSKKKECELTDTESAIVIESARKAKETQTKLPEEKRATIAQGIETYVRQLPRV